MWDYLPTDAFHDQTWTEAMPDLTISDCEFECHSCGYATTGYQMGELMVEQGWRLHSTGKGKPFFVMCGDREERYSEKIGG